MVDFQSLKEKHEIVENIVEAVGIDLLLDIYCLFSAPGWAKNIHCIAFATGSVLPKPILFLKKIKERERKKEKRSYFSVCFLVFVMLLF